MEIYVFIWLLLKAVTEMTTDHWFEICENNDDKSHKINAQIKYMIIIIVQYKMDKNVPFIVQFNEYCNKIDIGHSFYQFLM